MARRRAALRLPEPEYPGLPAVGYYDAGDWSAAARYATIVIY